MTTDEPLIDVGSGCSGTTTSLLHQQQQQPRIPKKKKFTHNDNGYDAVMANDGNAKRSSNANGNNDTETTTTTTTVAGMVVAAVDDGKSNSNSSKLPATTTATEVVDVAVSQAAAHTETTTTTTHAEMMPLFDPPILRKGDLVRLSNEQKSGRIQGGLARITRVIFATTTTDDDKRAGEQVAALLLLPTGYDIEYVLGGKLSNLSRSDLEYTTATAEGLVDATDHSRGHLLRRRRPTEKKAADDDVEPTPTKRKPGRPKSTGGNDAATSPVTRKPGKPKATTGGNDDVETTPIKRKPGRPPKNRVTEEGVVVVVAAAAAPSTQLSKKAATAGKKRKTSDNDCNAPATDNDNNNRSQIAKLGWEKRRAKEAASKGGTRGSDANVKRSNKRNSHTDTTSESDATSTAGYTEELSGLRRLDIYTKQRKEMEKSLQRLEKVDRFGFFLDATPPEFDENYDHNDDDADVVDDDNIPGEDDTRKKDVQFPNQPPFNFLVVRKRLAAGRYNVDMVAAEVNRLREIRAMVDDSSGTGGEGKHVAEVDYDELKQSTCNPIAVDWDTFNADIVDMCDAALVRDPEGPSLGSGHLGWAAVKIKKMMEQMYLSYGCKRRLEVEENEARERYEKILLKCGNTEAAMQGKWRKEAFPERKYERLQTSSVICDGLSPKDRSYAMYELETKLPDSFVGLAYTYDDSGQLSEMWMKTVADETNQNKLKKSRQKKKKKDAEDDSDVVGSQDESTAQKAAMALAKDDGVVRAQVQTTMANLLIQVQDRVMTDLGVMHSPEARSANWDDGDHGRDYRGGGAEVEQGTQSVLSLPEVAEQEVWGIDCYTRKNVMTLIESEFTPEIAVEFVEKWLLPAINACPIDRAYKMSTAARILEGLEPIASAQTKTNLLDDTTSVSSDADGTSDEPCQPRETLSDNRIIQESCVFLRDALKSKIKEHSPPWLKAAARLIRLASDSMDDDYFRIHPKGHGSVVIGEGGLKANSLVTYYRGEVYPAWRWCEKLDAIEHVQKKLNLRPNLPDFYNMAMERPKKDPRGYCLLFVDASRKSGLGSSFSHSCNPTCEVRVVSLNGKLSLSMTTLRDLEQGEELTFDYNAVTESLNEYRFAVCLCGQKKCRGSFLHYATADCYQQVLSRNSPISARFANLVRGCMKKVMSKEDSELLLKHGFNTAAFGAVSFNHHVNVVDSQSNPDSIENVPVWLRTYVADCLRYIEYERRALPVALLCNQMERLEKKQPKVKASLPKKETPAPEPESSSSKQKSIAGSKPATSYFYFLQSQRDHWESIARQNYGELKGLEFSQEVNKAASRAWSNLTDEEKMSWKNKSIADWEKSGGKEKAKEEAERQRELKKRTDELAKSSELTKAADKQKAKDAEETVVKDKPAALDGLVETKSISIADADAEGFSAMEQRIQQLAQSLSRIGRVLDRHRESVCAERDDTATSIDSDVLRGLVPCPLKIMTDDEVVNWIWSDREGVVHALFSMIASQFPEHSLLMKLLSNTKSSFPVLSAFHQNHACQLLDRKGKNACTSAHARKLLREALLNFRMNITDFLTLAEKSYSDARNEKRREQARAREQKKQGSKVIAGLEMSQDSTDPSNEFKIASEEMQHQPILRTGSESGTEITAASVQIVSSVQGGGDAIESVLGEEVISMRGGGGECASTFHQTSTGFSTSIMNPIEDTNSMLCDAPTSTDTSHVPFTTIEDAQASSQFKCVASLSNDQRVEDDPRPVNTNIESHVRGVNSESAIGVLSLLTLQQLPVDTTANVGNALPGTHVMPCNELTIDDGTSNNNDDGIANTAAVPVPTTSLVLTGELPSAPAIIEAESKKSRKKNVPMSEYQVKYLKDWLFHPKHILNPYPTEEEKSIMMKDIGITERGRLDSWFMKHRHRVLNPEVKPVNMKWRSEDQNHWETFRKSRYMLEATADLLLVYANTNTFFLLEPFRHFDSTPIDVYARELGNEVPCNFALNSQNGIGLTPDVVTSVGDSGEGLRVIESAGKAKAIESNAFCPPDEVIDKVIVEYTGEYVLSQLLQWFNGGIGQKKGLPDTYGCVMLPPITGCWEEINCSEVKLPNYTRWNHCTTTEYTAVARPKLAEWIVDRYQRGSPWDPDWAKYLCPSNQTSPDPTLPMGSPVLDYLVTGNDENIQHVSSALRGDASTSEQGRSKMSSSDRLQSTVDDGMPAQAVANWVQCENPKCLKWRKLPWHVDVDLLPEKFFCKDNVWNPKSQYCEAIEDEWDMGDAPIKFDTNDENFEVGAWFDVQREGKVGYHEAQVIEVDLEANVKRIKFHFWKLPSDRDEWIVVGSPRIAPHHSYTPRPLEGYSSKSKRTSDKSKVLINELPGDATRNKKILDKTKEPVNELPGDATRNKKILKTKEPVNELLGDAAGSKKPADKILESITESPGDETIILPQKRKVDHSDEMEPKRDGSADGPAGFALFAKPIIEYLNQWMVQHVDNPYPTPTEKAKIIADTGLTKRQVGDWMARSRKKLKAKSDSQQSINNNEPALTLSNDLTMMDSAQSNPAEIMLCDFRNHSSMSVQDIPGNSDKMIPVGENNAEEKMFDTSPLLIDPGNSNKPTTIKEVETVLKTWLNSLEGNLFPTLAQKESLIHATGIDKKRLEGWFFRARKKIKNQESLNVINETTETNITIESSASGSEVKQLNDHNPYGGPLASLPTSNASVPLESELYTPQTSGVIANHDESDLGSNSKGLTQEAKNYLSRWLSEHAANPYPSREEKDAMMSQLGISNERKLEGWFCRARKHQKKQQNDNSIDKDSKNQKSEENTHMSTDSERPPSFGAGGAIDSSNQKSESLLMGSPLLSSNFASLLSAAKSELSEEPWRNSSHSHVFNQGTGTESTTNQHMLSQHPVRMSKYYGAQQDFAPHYNADNSSNHRVLRASPLEHTEYQHPHGHYASDDYASYPESYHYGATYADNASNYTLQGHAMRASPAGYMHESVQVQAHEIANPRANYATYYRHDGDRQQVQRYSYPRPDHNDGSQDPGVDGNGFRQTQTHYEQQH